MKFLDIFNEIQKGNFALTDEAIYSSLQNGDELLPLYGGNKDHNTTERRISRSATTKTGSRITIFSGEGIIISLDGSAGNMTYKNGERFALNHHAGFITQNQDFARKVKLEYFAIFMQNYYQSLSVSDGSKTLSLAQIYSEEFELPSFNVQCQVLEKLKNVSLKVKKLINIKNQFQSLIDRELSIEYGKYQAKNVNIGTCLDCLSGNSGLTEEFIYGMMQSSNERYSILSSATEVRTLMGTVPLCSIGDRPVKVFENKEGLLVTRNGKAGETRYLPEGKYTINDHAYILFLKSDSPFEIDLQWLALQYKSSFLSYSSSADNGTWNMTGFFRYTKLDIPEIEEQQQVVHLFDVVKSRIEFINKIDERYNALLEKVVVSTSK